MTAVVRDKEFTPAADAHVSAHMIGPEGTTAVVEMAPVPNTPGTLCRWTGRRRSRAAMSRR